MIHLIKYAASRKVFVKLFQRNGNSVILIFVSELLSKIETVKVEITQVPVNPPPPFPPVETHQAVSYFLNRVRLNVSNKYYKQGCHIKLKLKI
jgi:hypothetical protein